MTIQLVICSNDETICDGYTDDRTASWEKEIAVEFVQAAADVIRRSSLDVDYIVDSCFPHWHGGKHTKFQFGSTPWGYSGGLVVCHEQEVSDEVKALCDAAHEAGAEARDEYIARLEAEAGIVDS